MEDMRIKVSTSKLIEVSDQLEAKLVKAQRTFEQIESIISRTSSYWEGNGHNAMIKGYTRRSDDFGRVINGIRNQVRSLKTIAGVYSQVEEESKELSNQLLGDIIE